MHINYDFRAMAQGAVDIGDATKRVADLQAQFQTAMVNLMAAWQSQSGSVQLQEVQRLWTQANEEINLLLGRQGVALDDAWVGMKRADDHSADALNLGRMA